ncbi:hypothetical protein NE237_010652 [Protea cynaroides]|uniref:GIR1-like zinc ribbon domain-containing protein n=1 Tax=Protea cynaroides TaxID=273540 RepID=A0A9Q0R1T6_9MAGN|nr:hypothetical protein NE237_010652 [Protea cynaroides]
MNEETLPAIPCCFSRSTSLFLQARRKSSVSRPVTSIIEETSGFGETNMSRNSKTPKLDLKLNLSPPRVNPRGDSPSRSASLSPTSPTSPQSSCVSSELSPDETLLYSNSPEATSMLLVGCPRCLMYVMLSEKEPKCPKCKSTVLLDFLHDTNITNKKSRSN